MTIQVLKNDTYTDATLLPKAATDRSTGYDIIATSEPEIVGEKTENGYSRIDYIQYKTNLKVAVQKDHRSTSVDNGFARYEIDYDILAMPRSSVSKYNLVLANSIGLIDADYRGEILVRFKYVWQPEDYKLNTLNKLEGTPNLDRIYKKGDKICQLKVTRVEHAEFVLVDELDATQRGSGGFGSTDAAPKTQSVSPILENYNKLAINTPTRKYSEMIKERESKQFNN